MGIKTRRLIVVLAALAGVAVWLVVNPASYEEVFRRVENGGADYAAVASGGAGSDADGDSAESEGDANGGGIGGGDTSDGGGHAAPLAMEILAKLEVKGRAPKTGYAREEFYNGWPTVDGCSLRQKIIRREFGASAMMDGCNVLSGEYEEPYTGQYLKYATREEISKGVQIDHVVALSDAWQKGAQYMEYETRYAMATDPLNLLAVDA